MVKVIVIAFATCLAFILHCEAAEPDRPRYKISRTEIHTVSSEDLEHDYQLFVKLPPRYHDPTNKNRRYPVIYFNDASYCFEVASGITVAPMNLGGFEHAILVGISYAVGESGADSRARDLTPVPLPQAKREHGGARAYLTFKEGGDFLQVHDSHADKGLRPHAHKGERHTSPDGSKTRTERVDTEVGQAMTDADNGLKDGSLRQRESRLDKGGE
ncbi:MAG: hypothetical protein AAFR03_05520 [Pseudomonadota bacterium]